MKRALILLVACAACAHGEPRADEPKEAVPAPSVVTEVQGDTLTRTFDLNHDGKPDDWKVWKLLADAAGKTREVLIERRLDTNFDGKPDVTTWFAEDGSKVKEAFDLDFDGRVDVVHFYEKGVLVRKETFGQDPRRPEAVAFYEGGKRVRVERDTKGRGKPDTWEYYEEGRLQRIGEDLDGDGIVDRWVKAKDDEGPALPDAAAKAAAAKGK